MIPLAGHDLLWWNEERTESTYGSGYKTHNVVVYGCSCGTKLEENAQKFVDHCLSVLGANPKARSR